MPGMKKYECATEGCTSSYDGEDYGVELTWHCLKCTQPKTGLMDRKKGTRQTVLQTASTDRVRLRYWARWAETEGVRLGLIVEPNLPERRSRKTVRGRDSETQS